MAVGVTSPEALRSPSLVACTSSPFHFRVLPGCTSSSEMSKRSEGPSAARVCERQRDVEAPVSDTVRGTLRESLIVAPAPRCCVGPGCQWVHAGSGSVAGRRAGCPQFPRLRGPLSPQGPWCPMLSRQESSPGSASPMLSDWPILPKDRLDALARCMSKPRGRFPVDRRHSQTHRD